MSKGFNQVWNSNNFWAVDTYNVKISNWINFYIIIIKPVWNFSTVQIIFNIDSSSIGSPDVRLIANTAHIEMNISISIELMWYSSKKAITTSSNIKSSSA